LEEKSAKGNIICEAGRIKEGWAECGHKDGLPRWV